MLLDVVTVALTSLLYLETKLFSFFVWLLFGFGGVVFGIRMYWDWICGGSVGG